MPCPMASCKPGNVSKRLLLLIKKALRIQSLGPWYHVDTDTLTGDSQPVYQLPYWKIPSELCVIKNYLQHMLSMKVTKPRNSPYWSPCIRIHKLLQKGKPLSPRFVIDYQYFNPSIWTGLFANLNDWRVPKWLPLLTWLFHVRWRWNLVMIHYG